MPRPPARFFFAAGLVAAVLLLQGCLATSRLQPNRRLAPGETVGSVNANLTGFVLPMRLGVNVAHGGEHGELLGGMGIGWDGLELGGGARAHLGPVNLAARLGLIVPLLDSGSGLEVVAAGWDLRLTTRSSPRLPLYAGVQTTGGLGLSEPGALAHVGLLAGFEYWSGSAGMQVELGYTPLSWTEDGWEPYSTCFIECSYSPIGRFHLGFAIHFGGDAR